MSEAVVADTGDINVTDVEESNEESFAEADGYADVESEESSGQDVAEANTKKPNTINKLVRFPLARVKSIIKIDPDCSLVSQESVMLLAKATDLFIGWLSKEMGKYPVAAKRKTLVKRDLMTAVETIDNLCFLEGMLD